MLNWCFNRLSHPEVQPKNVHTKELCVQLSSLIIRLYLVEKTQLIYSTTERYCTEIAFHRSEVSWTACYTYSTNTKITVLLSFFCLISDCIERSSSAARPANACSHIAIPFKALSSAPSQCGNFHFHARLKDGSVHYRPPR